ncbi:MAG TPA: NAD(P)-dependent oxidoreductase [Solirubrobacteraceae bacterium]|nr:NAD(P)-dependent oxidoreductase [Solirubrobacteraceae bacterium]
MALPASGALRYRPSTVRIFLTGASGFIGRALCPQLLARGHEVSALVRRAGSEPPGTYPFAGDLSDGARLAQAVSEARPDCVIHLAAEIASQRDARRVRAVNVDGTTRLIGACLALGDGGAAPGPRFVFASTVVTGDAHGALLREDAPLPVETPYGRSKQEGERLVLDSGLPAVVVRPSHVYGPGGWYAEELVPRLHQPGRFAVIGSGKNLWDVVHVQDLVSALILAAESAPEGSIYHVADDQPVTFGEFMAFTARTAGVGAPRSIPAPIARLVAGRNAVDAVVRSARSSNAKIKRELGWSPRFPSFREGVPDALGVSAS